MLNRAISAESPGIPESTDGRATRWEGQRQRRRAEFVDAAIQAIGEHGPDVSIELIAEQAGVARPRIYRHFSGKADLEAAVSKRIVESLIVALAPVWRPEGSPAQMIDEAMRKLLDWISENAHLYRYVMIAEARSSSSAYTAGLKTMVGDHLTRMFASYLRAFGLDVASAEPLAFGLVGMVDSVVARWQDFPGNYDKNQLAEYMAGWAWAAIDQSLRTHGVHLDPGKPLPPPEELSS